MKYRRHEHFMRLASNLAERGRGSVSPNPVVGAVIVKKGRIVGKGWHRRFGGAHAEVEALRAAGEKAKGGNLYVTLEPCSTWGKTGPCTDVILKSGLRRIFVGAIDPNPRHSGRGIRKLRSAGLTVKVGILREEIEQQNVGFFSLMRKKRPYVILKMAQSLDGKIATGQGESRWITSERTRDFVQQLRKRADAIMVGTNTLLSDNPGLALYNGYAGTKPTRVVLDRTLKVPTSAQVFRKNGARVLLVTSPSRVCRAERRLRSSRIEVFGVPSRRNKFDLKLLMRELGKRGITSLLVEGGGELASSLLQARLVDQIYWCIAPKFIGGKEAITSVEGKGVFSLSRAPVLQKRAILESGDDIIIEGRF